MIEAPSAPIIPVGVLTLNEAAAVLRCSKGHLSNVLAGRVKGLPPLPRITIGRRTLIRREALGAWLESVERLRN